jgi:hypothetical protein
MNDYCQLAASSVNANPPAAGVAAELARVAERRRRAAAAHAGRRRPGAGPSPLAGAVHPEDAGRAGGGVEGGGGRRGGQGGGAAAVLVGGDEEAEGEGGEEAKLEGVELGERELGDRRPAEEENSSGC